MNSFWLPSPAKINFGLKILSLRKDGYHEIETILQQVRLSDFIHFEETPGTIRFTCNEKSLTSNENLVYQAALLLTHRFNLNLGVSIHLEKNIPISAGLGGGSSNAAVTLWGLNKLWKINLQQSQLIEMAKELGSDVPFFLFGARAIGKGRGDELTSLPNYEKNTLLLVNPGIQISTAWVYKNLNLGLTNNQKDIKLLALSLSRGDIQQLGKLLFNDLESVLLPRFPILGEIKTLLFESGAAGSLVSGSGSTVFAVFENLEQAQEAAKTFKECREKTWRVFLTETLTEEEVSSIFKINLSQEIKKTQSRMEKD